MAGRTQRRILIDRMKRVIRDLDKAAHGLNYCHNVYAEKAPDRAPKMRLIIGTLVLAAENIERFIKEDS